MEYFVIQFQNSDKKENLDNQIWRYKFRRKFLKTVYSFI